MFLEISQLTGKHLHGGPLLPIKTNKNKSKKKKNKEIEKMKKILFRKKPHKIIMAHACQIWLKYFFIQKEKKHKITMAHECQVTRFYV